MGSTSGLARLLYKKIAPSTRDGAIRVATLFADLLLGVDGASSASQPAERPWVYLTSVPRALNAAQASRPTGMDRCFQETQSTGSACGSGVHSLFRAWRRLSPYPALCASLEELLLPITAFANSNVGFEYRSAFPAVSTKKPAAFSRVGDSPRRRCCGPAASRRSQPRRSPARRR